jgi:polyisoprenoid-binding protein YceI
MTTIDTTPAAGSSEQAAATREVDGRTVPAAGRYSIDAAHTTVGFVARHLMVAKVRGQFPVSSGSLVVGENPLDSSLEVEMDVAAVATGEEQRDAHLRSADFFDVERFPTMRYVASSVRPSGRDWVVEGELTIRDESRPVELQLEFLGAVKDPWGGERLAFSASAEIDREQFGLTWNVALEAGGVLVGKIIKIEIEAELVRA